MFNININYTNIKNNTIQYKKVEKEKLAALMEEEAAMTPEQKMLYELLGGRKAHMQNVMRQYNSDGDFTAGGLVVPGMDATGIPESERHQIISISEDSRQKMFDNCKMK